MYNRQPANSGPALPTRKDRSWSFFTGVTVEGNTAYVSLSEIDVAECLAELKKWQVKNNQKGRSRKRPNVPKVQLPIQQTSGESMSSPADGDPSPDLPAENERKLHRLHVTAFFKKLADLGIDVHTLEGAEELMGAGVEESNRQFRQPRLKEKGRRRSSSNAMADIKSLTAEIRQ